MTFRFLTCVEDRNIKLAWVYPVFELDLSLALAK